MSRKAQRIVVRRVDNLGDIVIALPVLEALRANHPDALLFLMVKEAQQVLCKHIADAFLKPVDLERFPGIARKYDLAYNVDYFHNKLQETKAHEHIRYINAVPGTKAKHIGSHLLDGVRIHGLRYSPARVPSFPISSELRRTAVAVVHSANVLPKRSMWIGVHVGSREPMKCWPVEKYIKLARWLHTAFGAHLFFFGTPGESSSINAVYGSLPPGTATKFVGEPLDIVAALLARMDFIIGNDSGISHLAAAVRTPTVSLFGPTSPVLWRPAGNRSILVLRPLPSTSKKSSTPIPLQTVAQVKQGVLLCIQKHVNRTKFSVLDVLRISDTIDIERTSKGTIVRSSKRGSACLVQDGWLRVKSILKAVEKHQSYSATLHLFPDAGALLDIFILHGIILQGR